MSIPLPKVYWPFTPVAAGAMVVVNNGADHTISITVGAYYSAALLAAAIQAGLSAYITACSVTVDATGFLTVSGTTAFTLKFTVMDATNAQALGFYQTNYAATLAVGVYSVTSPKQVSNGFWCPVAVRRDTRDLSEEPNTVSTVTFAGNIKTLSETRLIHRTVEIQFLDLTRTFMDGEGVSPTAIERWWRTGRGRFRYWADGTVEGTYGDYALDGGVLAGGFTPERMFDGKELYRVGPWKMRKFL